MSIVSNVSAGLRVNPIHPQILKILIQTLACCSRCLFKLSALGFVRLMDVRIKKR